MTPAFVGQKKCIPMHSITMHSSSEPHSTPNSRNGSVTRPAIRPLLANLLALRGDGGVAHAAAPLSTVAICLKSASRSSGSA